LAKHARLKRFAWAPNSEVRLLVQAPPHQKYKPSRQPIADFPLIAGTWLTPT
jgi:hypothetical protein